MRVTILFKSDTPLDVYGNSARLYFDRVCAWLYEDVGSPAETVDQCLRVGSALVEDDVAQVELDKNEDSLAARLEQHMFNTHEFEVFNGQKYYSREGLRRVLNEYRANTETRTE